MRSPFWRVFRTWSPLAAFFAFTALAYAIASGALHP